MNKEEFVTMTKEQYMEAIMKLLDQCNEEKIWYYIKSFLEKMVDSPV